MAMWLCLLLFISYKLSLSNSDIFDTPHLTWVIDDPSLIDEILTANSTHSFESTVFELNSFKWFIRVSPNGRTNQESGSFMLALVLVTFPPDVSFITCRPTFQITETYTFYKFTKPVIYDKMGKSYRWGTATLPFESIQNLSTLSIRISPNIMHGFGDLVTKHIVPVRFDQIIAVIPKSTIHISHTWSLSHDIKRIKRTKPGLTHKWLSPRFGQTDLFEFEMQFWPNGYPKEEGNVLLFLYFVCLDDDIGDIFIKYRLWFVEANVKFSNQRELHNPNNHFTILWSEMLRNDELRHLDSITIVCEIDVIEIYDRQHRIVTDYYAFTPILDDIYDKNTEYLVDDYGKILLVLPREDINGDGDDVVLYNNETEQDKGNYYYEYGMDDWRVSFMFGEGEEEELDIDDGVTILLKWLLVIYCAGIHCSVFAVSYHEDKLTKPTNVIIHCVLTFLYYYLCVFFIQ